MDNGGKVVGSNPLALTLPLTLTLTLTIINLHYYPNRSPLLEL